MNYADVSQCGALGSVLVILGVVLKNSMQQMGKGDSMAGMISFVAGWALVAHAVAKNQFNVGGNQTLPYVAAAIVVGAVMAMKIGTNEEKKKRMKPLLLAFIVGWILFGYSMNANSMMVGISVAMVFLSMLFFLPKQRKNCIVDGPGFPLFVLAWVGLWLANNGMKI